MLLCAGFWLLTSASFTDAKWIHFNLVSGCYHYRGTAWQNLQFIHTCLVFLFFFSPEALIYLLACGSLQPSVTQSTVIQAGRLTLNCHWRLAAHTARVEHFIYPLTDLWPAKTYSYTVWVFSTMCAPCKTAPSATIYYQVSGYICQNNKCQ